MREDLLHIDPTIARAHTLAADVYTDRSIFDAVRERVFARSWQLVADGRELRTPGQVKPITLLEGLIDEPLVLVRDAGDQLRCMSNVCTHRGALVVEQPGQGCSGLRCRYHGRRFGLDGTCLSMPEFEQVEGFPAPCDHLPHASVATRGPWVFAAVEPAHTLNDLFADIDRRLGWLPWDQFTFDPGRSRDYLVQANWALYCDNYLEGFHIPFVHSALSTQLDYGAYRTELFELSNVQVGVASGGEHVFDLPPESPDHGQEIAGYFYWLWPNTMFNFYPWGASINIVKPIDIDRTRVSYLTYIWDESKLDHGAGANLDRVEREDECIVEAVQRGVRSRFYDRGRFSPTREQGVHHFHQLLARHLQSS